MRIAIIGTTAYQKKMHNHARNIRGGGDTVCFPAFDNHPELDDLGVCEHNRDLIEWADEIHLFWDQRSMGTVFDFGMCFALRKPVKIIYMETKTFRGVMEKYSHRENEGAQ
jgi:nucleoside 2-deoxyribosyltransferase